MTAFPDHAPTRATPAHPQGETLHVLVTRHPYEWAASMRRNGFYASLHKGRAMADFLTLQWMSLDISPTHQPL